MKHFYGKWDSGLYYCLKNEKDRKWQENEQKK